MKTAKSLSTCLLALFATCVMAQEVGKVVPQFNTKAIDGQKATVASLAKGKKYVLITFWASWCQPCRREISNVKKAYASFKKKGFDAVSISVDSNKPDWQKALKEEQMPWAQYFDRDGMARLYNARMIPATFLINAKGVLIAKDIRGEALINKLKELMP